MLSRTVILPAADARWEVWRCGNASGSVWQGSAENLSAGANGSRSMVVALPARSCRTFAFSAPTADPQLLRKLAFAQVEKRGLTAAGLEQTAFNCHVLGQRDGQSLVSVDVLTTEAAGTLNGSVAGALVASSRLFPIPEGKLVVLQEQGRLVLCAGTGGRLLHSQIVSATGDLNGHAAPEIRIASLALQQQGIVSEITGLELWGDFSPADAQQLGEQLGLPVEAKARPTPHSSNLRRDASAHLLPPAARQALRRRRLLGLRWVAVAALVLPVVLWVLGERKKLHALEAEAARIESTLNINQSTGGSAEQDRLRAEHAVVTAAQARWAALRMALEPRRYPVAHLDALSRCLGVADVVLTRFESKLADASVAGTARSAMDAYNYFNAVSKDAALGVYAWTMLPPIIAANGSATFEMKGKMR
ncbi:MAG TPA: hypothetical protein VGO90_01145 [Chthoniobacteraceae bacterium]|jgi:hypothetical protein|nr:hypothetical protein [Chthoniobacter sp.]HEV7866257.1 hypothetical protein [Chthoniobacteraceae bacterium]